MHVMASHYRVGGPRKNRLTPRPGRSESDHSHLESDTPCERGDLSRSGGEEDAFTQMIKKICPHV